MPPARTAQTLAEYLTVGAAAEYLGVSPWTLRNWDRSGKLASNRHPINGYRIYRQKDLEALLQQGAQLRAAVAPRIDWTEMGEREHFVQFYEEDTFLIEAVAGFVGAALDAEEGAVVIATRAHRRGLEKQLKARGLDLDAARNWDQLVLLDAAGTLAKFMVDDLPNPRKFAEIIGPVIVRAAHGGRRVRAFGEMVALLWAEGNRDAAVRLEELWNDLLQHNSFALFCAYPIEGFSREEHGDPFDHICKHHSRVIPAESYAALALPEERLREITRLQQKAQALEAEVAQRKEAEDALREADRVKDQFVRTLADQLRNTLVPLHNGLQLQSQTGDPRPVQALLERQVEQLTQLVDDLTQLPSLPGTECGPPAEAAARLEPRPAAGLRVLVVDDNRDAADSLGMLLNFLGHTADVANSGPAALTAIAHAPPDVVFLDLGMPGMDGYEVARRLRAQPSLRDLVLIALTGWGQDEDRRRCREAGIDHHLLKPVAFDTVQALLSSLAGRKRGRA